MFQPLVTFRQSHQNLQLTNLFPIWYVIDITVNMSEQIVGNYSVFVLRKCSGNFRGLLYQSRPFGSRKKLRFQWSTPFYSVVVRRTLRQLPHWVLAELLLGRSACHQCWAPQGRSAALPDVCIPRQSNYNVSIPDHLLSNTSSCFAYSVGAGEDQHERRKGHSCL